MKITTELVEVVCWCGVPHAIPAALDDQANRKGMAVHCPLGHKWVTKDPEHERLKRENAGLRDARERLIRQRDDEARAHSATKAQLTKARNRIAKGVCPCCNRQFVNVARHMASKHPEFPQ